MNGLDLKVFGSRARGAWMLLAVAVGIYALLVQREVPWLSDNKPQGIPTGVFQLQVLVFAGIGLGETMTDLCTEARI